MGKVSKRIGWEIAKNVFLPSVLFLAFLGLYILYKTKFIFYVSSDLQKELKKYVLTIFIIIIGYIIQKIVGAVCSWYKEAIAFKTETRLDDDFIPIIRRTFKIIVWVIATLVILPFYGINISALIAALGVSSLAIALAAQDTIANIISGFMIMVDKPFRVGDRIKIPSGEIVDVLEIGVRRSKFLSEDKAIIIMPNVDLSKSKIINYTYGEERIQEEKQK